MMFAVRREVLDALLADVEWSKRFDWAKTTEFFIIHVSKLGKVKFNSKKRFTEYIDLLGDKLERLWFEVKKET